MVKNRTYFTLIYVLFLVVFFTAFSCIASAQALCDLQQFENQFTLLNNGISLHTENSGNYWSMVDLVDKTTKLDAQIKACIDVTQKQLNRMNQFLSEEQKRAPLNKNIQKSINDIQQQVTDKNGVISIYQLLRYQIHSILSITTSYDTENNPFNLKQRGPSVWDVLHGLSFNSSFQFNTLYQRSGIDRLSKTNVIALLTLFLFTFTACTYFINKVNLSLPFLLSIRSVIQKYIPIFVSLCILDLYLHVLFRSMTSTSTLILLTQATLLYLFVCMVIKTDLARDPKTPVWPNVVTNYSFALILILAAYNWILLVTTTVVAATSVKFFDLRVPTYITLGLYVFLMIVTRDKTRAVERVMHQLLRRLYIIATLSIVCYYVGVLLLGEILSSGSFIALSGAIFITLFNMALLWLNWLVFKTAYFDKYASKIRLKTMQFALVSVYVVIISLGWFGYYHFALLFMPNLFCLIMLVLLAKKINSSICQLTNSSDHPLARKIHAYFGYPRKERIVGLAMIRILMMFAFLSYSIIAIMQLYGVILLYETKEIIEWFSQGIPIFNMTINPVRLLRACFIFFILLLFSRRIAMESKKWVLASNDKNMVMMIYSITQYISISIALLISLVIAGINLTGLAIVSGSFSFGLALGLQQFVKDLASGIYIIINKSIQVTDQVSIEGIDGVVKQIGLFSTQITTSNHSDLIVPNSKITMDAIVNYTFLSNNLCRLNLMIKLQNDEDIELGKQLLLDIANNNPDVIHSPPYEPTVLFESNHLTLWCEISNITKKSLVLSDLNYTVKHIFNEKKIPMQLGAGIVP